MSNPLNKAEKTHRNSDGTDSGADNHDAAMVRAFLEGDRQGFDNLVIKYKDRIFNLCYRFLGDHQDANDAAQDVFIKVYRSVKKFRFESTFSTWLYRIAVNTCKSRLTSRAHKNKAKTDSLDDTGRHNPSAPLSNHSNSPVATLEKKERMAHIQKAIDSLSGSKKMVVIMRDMEGLSYEEIARASGLNLGTVKSKIARARRDLRNKLRGIL
jgi:RNA polymerase sigma-70 factor (ECF subfamily)